MWIPNRIFHNRKSDITHAFLLLRFPLRLFDNILLKMATPRKTSTVNQRHFGLDLLKMIPSDLKVFDNISVSSEQESDLSEPFSDVEKSEAFIEKRKSEDLRNTDLYSYFSFSEEFKSAMESVKSETEISSNETVQENESETEAENKKSQIFSSLEEDVKSMLESIVSSFQEKITSSGEDKKSNLETPSAERKSKSKSEKKKVVVEEEEEYYDTMSGYWRMLSAYEDFKISPPYYNAYENDKPHWLETKPIPFEVMEQTNKKCLDWLRENFQS